MATASAAARRRSLVFVDASGAGIEHLFHPGCDGWSEAVERYDAGHRWFDAEAGTFHRSAPRDEHALTVARSAPGDWRLPPRTLPPKDFLAAEPEHVPVDLITRSRPDAPTLKLGSSARRDLDNLAAESRGGAETGGFFYGHREGAEGPRVFVSQLRRMVEDSTSHALRLDMVANVNHKLFLRSEGADHLCELGAWHTHPGTHNGEPSETDLQMLVSGLDHAAGRKDLSRYFGVIVTPGRNCGWLVPDLHGWMVTRRSGRAVCERVKVS